MISLGIESTAHTFGVGIVTDKGKILADVRKVYVPRIGSGIVPHEAKKHHEKVKNDVFKSAIEKAELKINEIDIISFACGPGLPPALLVGANFAVELARKYKKPLVKVCHQLAHVEIGKLMTSAKNPIVSYHSGGSSQTIAFSGGRYRVFGECHGMALGNVLDVVAREMGLRMPGGPEIEKLAVKGKYIELPYTVKGMNFSLTGILTASINLLKKGVPKEDVAYSLQETCFAMLTEVTERALAHVGKEEVLLVGGVAANKRLKKMMLTMCSERGAKMYVVPSEYAADNGANIAWTGILAYKSGWKPDFKDKINPRWRIDEVEITWV